MTPTHGNAGAPYRRCWLILLAAFWLAGCYQNWDECDDSNDCQAGYICRMGSCEPGTPIDGGEDVYAESSDDTSSWEDPEDVTIPDRPADPDAEGEFDGACGVVSFPLTETQELLIIPPNVRYMHVKAWGAGGNEEHPPGTCPGIVDDGGLGGFSEAVFEVTPGTTLIVIVGGPGSASADTVPPEQRMRFGWGTDGGGGLSGVFLGPDRITDVDQVKALIIAGGGGGSVGDCANPGGTGNSEQAGGAPTMMGTAGAEGVNGGAGGYFGGSGGARDKPGMGGTGFVAGSATDSVTKHSDPGAGVPPETEDTDYVAPAGQYESDGLVVIHFTCEPPPII